VFADLLFRLAVETVLNLIPKKTREFLKIPFLIIGIPMLVLGIYALNGADSGGMGDGELEFRMVIFGFIFTSIGGLFFLHEQTLVEVSGKSDMIIDGSLKLIQNPVESHGELSDEHRKVGSKCSELECKGTVMYKSKFCYKHRNIE